MRRHVGVLVAAVLVAAACSGGSDHDPVVTGDGSTTTVVGAAVTETTSGPTTTAAPGGPSAASPPAGGPGGGATASPPPAGGGAQTIGVVSVGQLAPYLLRPGHGDRIVVEVRAQSGAAPTAATLDHLVRVLQDASGKPVLIDGPDAIGGSGEAWTPASLTSLADRSAEVPQGGQQLVLRLLFLRGSFQGDSSVLGVAVRGDVAAVFSDQGDAAAGLLVAPAVIEDAVSVHEVGHLLGLVDLIVGSGRGDPAHPGHSRNQDSVMYWAVESDLIGQLLDGGIPNELDPDDRAELATRRGG